MSKHSIYSSNCGQPLVSLSGEIKNLTLNGRSKLLIVYNEVSFEMSHSRHSNYKKICLPPHLVNIYFQFLILTSMRGKSKWFLKRIIILLNKFMRTVILWNDSWVQPSQCHRLWSSAWKGNIEIVIVTRDYLIWTCIWSNRFCGTSKFTIGGTTCFMTFALWQCWLEPNVRRLDAE